MVHKHLIYIASVCLLVIPGYSLFSKKPAPAPVVEDPVIIKPFVTRAWPKEFVPVKECPTDKTTLVAKIRLFAQKSTHYGPINQCTGSHEREIQLYKGVNDIEIPIDWFSSKGFNDDREFDMDAYFGKLGGFTVVSIDVFDGATEPVNVYTLPVVDRHQLVKDEWANSAMWPKGDESPLGTKLMELGSSYRQAVADDARELYYKTHNSLTKLSTEIKDVKQGLFEPTSYSKKIFQIVPNPGPLDNLEQYRDVGRQIGFYVAIGECMDVMFSIPVLKGILNLDIHYLDLKYVNPEEYDAYRFVRDNSVLRLQKSHNSPRIEYLVDQYLIKRYRDALNKYTQQQVDAIRQGVHDVIPEKTLTMFNMDQFGTLINGSNHEVLEKLYLLGEGTQSGATL